MPSYAYIDNSNVFIEGMRVSAVNKGMEANIVDAMNNGTVDFGWQFDYLKLRAIVCGMGDLDGWAKLWGSPPPGDPFWEMVTASGFVVQTYNRNLSNKEKKVDSGLITCLMRDAYTTLAEDKANTQIVLVAGDSDYVPTVQTLVADGYRVDVFFWDQVARELRDVASGFNSLNDHFDFLTYIRP